MQRRAVEQRLQVAAHDAALVLGAEVSELLQELDGLGQALGVREVRPEQDLGDAHQVRDLAVALRDKLEPESGLAVVAGISGGKVVLIIATSKKAREAGISSGKLVKETSAILGGGGGGKDDIAQGGGPEIGKLSTALQSIEKLVVS